MSLALVSLHQKQPRLCFDLCFMVCFWTSRRFPAFDAWWCHHRWKHEGYTLQQPRKHFLIGGMFSSTGLKSDKHGGSFGNVLLYYKNSSYFTKMCFCKHSDVRKKKPCSCWICVHFRSTAVSFTVSSFRDSAWTPSTSTSRTWAAANMTPRLWKLDVPLTEMLMEMTDPVDTYDYFYSFQLFYCIGESPNHVWPKWPIFIFIL